MGTEKDKGLLYTYGMADEVIETREYDNWTQYDEWLVSKCDPENDKSLPNYNKWAITKIEEKDGKLIVTMRQKA